MVGVAGRSKGCRACRRRKKGHVLTETRTTNIVSSSAIFNNQIVVTARELMKHASMTDGISL
ncbi:hypothetical protein CCHL11_02815 [Colletotrichum chlorophyti]|uniref:Uncharacterized protein n=1 Tax=Colletotrichum chlorophyti TaxID=708187 RepID=A0A1Q8S114_9PEZI|nr:hypothetical protein CCHL11_02815 [Colletotrichum chlorophyti]